MIVGSRVLTIGGVIGLVGLLPALAGREADLAIFRARAGDAEPTPAALESVRTDLGLDRPAPAIAMDWIGGVLRGDLGSSWVSDQPVAGPVFEALSVSLTLMAFALVVTLVVSLALLWPAVRAGLHGRPSRGQGPVAAALTALPEFLLAAGLLVLGAVALGWFPPFGWNGPEYAALPALALGLPAGGLIGRLLSVGVAEALAEPWVATWRSAGATDREVAAAALRRALPALLPQVGLVVVGLTAGAVAVERIYAIPGIGRLLLGAVAAFDLPTLQAGLLVLLLLAAAVGTAATLGTRLLLGSATAVAPPPELPPAPGRRRWIVPILSGATLVVIVIAGLPRDPYGAVADRLAAPSLAVPFGADANGRDLLARVAHGAVDTLGAAAVVTAACLVLGLLIGLAVRASTGPVEVANALPPILAGLVVAALVGPGALGAGIAVTAVGWAPLAAHTSALVRELHEAPHIQMLPLLGVGRGRTLLQHLLPAVFPTVARHAVLRLPGIALALASLSFLGLGARPPEPDWGLVLAEGIGYVERAPWTVLAPAGLLALTSVLAVSLSSGSPARTTQRPPIVHASRT